MGASLDGNSRPSELSIDEASDVLRSAGLRRTLSRVNVVQCLSRQTTPATHAQIVEQLSSLGFDASTIFRGLTDLLEADIVSRFDAGDRIWRFELRRDPTLLTNPYRQHPHVVCSICGRIECLDNEDYYRQYESLQNWRIDELLLKGVCGECHSQNNHSS